MRRKRMKKDTKRKQRTARIWRNIKGIRMRWKKKNTYRRISL
jgi:hypothetical protein